jgi:2-polyprenyl-3-methyl-5-hydroxy-6-metoxy-1,4-benzoquinol methylase
MEAKFERTLNPDAGYLSATPAPDPETLRKFYAELYYQAPQSSSYQAAYDELEISYKRLKCDALIHAILQLGIVGGKFLDIGAGEGFLLNAAHAKMFDITGIDFSAYGVGKFFPELSSRHIAGDVYESLDRLNVENKKYNVCTTTNVLEHVIDPDSFVESVRKVMEPDGVLVITVPNDFSDLQNLLMCRGMIDREFWFVPPHHLHYFNTKSLTTYLIDKGFKVLDAFSDFPVDLYLLHSGSNYVMDTTKGKEAHRARMLHDLMIADSGMDRYIDYYRAMFNVGIGRDITVIVRQQ